MEEIRLRQAMIETICSEMELIDTLQNGSGMMRGLPGEIRQAAHSTGLRRFSASKLFTVWYVGRNADSVKMALLLSVPQIRPRRFAWLHKRNKRKWLGFY